MSEFEEELTNLINKHSVENECDTPDFILAKYLNNSLLNFSLCVKGRDDWYKFKPWPDDGTPQANAATLSPPSDTDEGGASE